jgi:uncharacterized protein
LSTSLTFSPESRTFGAVSHLVGFTGLFLPVLAPLVLTPLVAALRPGDEFVRENAIESLNFQLSILVWGIVGAVLSIVLIGIPILLLAYLASLVLPAIGAMYAAAGETYRYPGTIRFF